MPFGRRQRVTTVGVAVAATALGLAACSSSSSSSASSGSSATSSASSSASTSTVSGTIKAAGSTFQTNFQQTAISAFKSADPNVTVDYDPVGSQLRAQPAEHHDHPGRPLRLLRHDGELLSVPR